MRCGIYIIDNKVYVGSSIDIDKRLYNHKYMLNKNGHDNNYLQNAFNKYGVLNFIFDTIEECGNNGSIRKTIYKHKWEILN